MSGLPCGVPLSRPEIFGARLFGTTMFGMAALVAVAAAPDRANAQNTDRINAIQQQINVLQRELRQMKADAARRDAVLRDAQREAAEAKQKAAQSASAPTVATAPPIAVAPPSPPLPLGEFQTGGVTVKIGGFIEAAGIYRSRNEVADIASSFGGIPLANTAANHESELRGSARQSRFTMLVQGKPDDATTLAAYAELDFQGAAPTANSTESNSYNPRIRQLYATYDRSDLGVHVLAGQAWSLLTLNQKGIDPRSEAPPLVIDAQYVPGFTWARQPQARFVKSLLNDALALGLSIESPQTNFSTSGFTIGANGVVLPNGGFANVNNPGGSGFASTVNYSSDIAPDIVVKAALDPGYGHYEAYGVARFLHDRVDNIGSGHNSTSIAGGGGAAALVPIIPGVLEFRGSFLAGYGIGRYGSGQIPDATIKPDGTPAPIPEVQALVGLVGHPIPAVDLYTYVGTEQAGRTSFDVGGKGFGYGSPLFINSGCFTELSPATCTGNTSSVTQGTIGGWWRFLHGNYGTMELGAQYSHTVRAVFSGVGGAPSANEDIVLLSFRYLPFQ
jgi:hypothetical protein